LVTLAPAVLRSVRVSWSCVTRPNLELDAPELRAALEDLCDGELAELVAGDLVERHELRDEFARPSLLRGELGTRDIEQAFHEGLRLVAFVQPLQPAEAFEGLALDFAGNGVALAAAAELLQVDLDVCDRVDGFAGRVPASARPTC
jgi:hypothetical protein